MFFKEHFTAKNIIFLILVLVSLRFLSQIMGIAMLFFASYVLACSISPMLNKMSKKIPRSVSSGLILTGIVIILFAFFIPLLTVSIDQVQVLYDVLPQRIQETQSYMLTHKVFGHNLAEMLDFQSILGSTSEFATNIFNKSVDATLAFAQAIVILLAVVMIVYYLLVDEEYIKKKFIEFFPEKMKAKAESISDTISQKVGGYVVAQIISMFAVGIMTTIFLFILRVDYSVSLGMITGLLDIIPLVGPTLALITILMVAFKCGPIVIALCILGFLAVQQISNNIVRPVVFGKFLDLNPLVIIFALFVAAQFLGVWGVILAPAIAATFCVLIDELYLKPINNKKQ